MNSINYNRLSEHSPTKLIPDRSVRTQPHLLELELLHAVFVRSNCRALDTHTVLLDRLSGINSDLVIRLIPVRQAKVVILQVDLKIWVDEFLLDILPYYPRHLIAVQLDDGILDLDLGDMGRHVAPLCQLRGYGSRKGTRRSDGGVGDGIGEGAGGQ